MRAFGAMVGISAVLAVGAASADAQTITEFPLPGNAEATGLTATPTALWAAAPGAVIRVTTAGAATSITSAGIASRYPYAITAGPDGRVWWAEQDNDDGDDAVGAVTDAGAATRFPDEISEFGSLADITPGLGVMWFTEAGNDAIGRINVATGVVREFDEGITVGEPTGITVGPDGNVWFTEAGGAIARFAPATSTITEFTNGLNPDGAPNDIVTGPDGNLYFTTFGAIGKVTIGGVITEIRAGLPPDAAPRQLTVGPDGGIWFTDEAGRIGRFDIAAGASTMYSDGLSADGAPDGIAVGPDGAIWFTLPGVGKIGRLTVPGPTPEPTPTPTPEPTATATPEPTATPVPTTIPQPAPRADTVAPVIAALGADRCRQRGQALNATFNLSENARVTYTIRRRVESKPQTRCPGTVGRKVPGTTVDAGRQESDAAAGQVVATLSRAKQTATKAAKRGRTKIKLKQVSGLQPGTYQLIVRATDAAGNRSTNQVVKFWVLAAS